MKELFGEGRVTNGFRKKEINFDAVIKQNNNDNKSESGKDCLNKNVHIHSFPISSYDIIIHYVRPFVLCNLFKGSTAISLENLQGKIKSNNKMVAGLETILFVYKLNGNIVLNIKFEGSWGGWFKVLPSKLCELN